MNYEEKYKQALGWMQSLYGGLHGITKEEAEHYFPELKESEGEMIRKDIISYLRNEKIVKRYISDIEVEKWIAWLENQDKQYIPAKEIILNVWELGEMWKEITKGMSNTEHGTQLDYILKHWNEGEHYTEWLEKQGEPEDKGEISDGYHTFNELYSYRMLYNAAFFNLLPKQLVHKSKRHHDGEECFGGGWFIVMANLPTGQISNHYELKDWDLFQIPEKEIADEWDGHTPQEAAERLHKYLLEKQGKQTHSVLGQSEVTKTSDKELEPKFKVGDKVVAKCNKTDVKTIEKVSQCGTYWTSSKEFSSGWWGEDELEPYVEPKMLNADKVIAWLVGNIIDFEDYVRAFKKDFGL